MTNIIISFPNIDNAKNIKNMLVRNGFTVVGVCNSGVQTLALAEEVQNGVIVCGCKFQDMMCGELRECLSDDFEICMVASQNMLSNYSFENVVSLEMPLKVRELVETLEMLCLNVDRRQRKKKGRPKVRSIEDEKYIQSAKELLMVRNHMSENDAHRYLQKSSMDSGTNLVETAQMILSLLKD